MFQSTFTGAAPMAALLSIVLTAQGPLPQGFDASSEAALPAGVALGGGVVPIHTAEADPDSGPYGIWAAADTYKVSFHGDMTFIPYLGSDYPENQPLSWRTTAVRIGSHDLMAPDAQPVRWHTDRRYEYRYGAFTEAYDVLEHGLEQTFVIHRRPATGGDLVVTGALATRMRAQPLERAHRALAFADHQGRELCSYGEAFAIDADGRRGKALTTCRQGAIELTVPGDWLAEAAFPVTIDPLLGASTLSQPGLPQARHVSVDVARDDNHDHLMVVWARAASGVDFDIRGMLCGNNFSNPTPVFADIGTNDTPHVRVASSGTRQNYCIAYESRSGTSLRVRYHVHSGGVLNFSSSFQTISVGSFGAGHDWRPDVGGTVERPPGGFTIVYQHESVGPFNPFQNTANSTIRATVLDVNGAVQHIVALQPAGAGGDMERPTINHNARNWNPTQWMVAWQEWRGSRWVLAARQVGSDGTASSSVWQESAVGDQRLGPVIDGMDGRYLVTYARSPTSALPGKAQTTNGRQVMAKRIDWARGSSTFSDLPERVVWSSSNRAWVVGGCAYDFDTASHWAIQAHSTRFGGGNSEIHIARVGFNGRVTESRRLFDPVICSPDSCEGLSGGLTYDDDNDRFVAVYSANSLKITQGLAYGNLFTYRTPAPPQVSGTSCSPANIAWFGSSQIGSEFPSVRLAGTSSNQPAFLLISLAPSNTPLDPIGLVSCQLLVASGGPAYLGVVSGSTGLSGAASVRLSLPEFLVTNFIYFQWFHGAPGANPLGIQSTQRLRVQIIK